ncbi:hypothetical protein MRB53_013156 [Persea americana]|uniref:Uncharacterized protein n=1 Tax=Persea americana TaxID=3435 RepID=A0ACC2K7D1_PERAE|nr:hypothetical protein MRB53_013156 [Persea americana]
MDSVLDDGYPSIFAPLIKENEFYHHADLAGSISFDELGITRMRRTVMGSITMDGLSLVRPCGRVAVLLFRAQRFEFIFITPMRFAAFGSSGLLSSYFGYVIIGSRMKIFSYPLRWIVLY